MTFNIGKVGVVGAGQMGRGIAQVCASAGLAVVLNDVSQDKVDASLVELAKAIRHDGEKTGVDTREIDARVARIEGASTYDRFGECDIVIEAVAEIESLKRTILAQLCPVLRADTILATNTSTISITRLASVTDRPERFMGIHFMNPVPKMQLVELIRGIVTSDDTFETSRAFVHGLHKTTTTSEDFPAFIVNRILVPMINEAIYTLYEGVGTVESIDTSMKLGANHPMGPLQLADFIGLDTCLAIMQSLHEGLADSKYRPCPLLVKYVEAGWLGRKTKRGFYDYRSGTPVPTR